MEKEITRLRTASKKRTFTLGILAFSTVLMTIIAVACAINTQARLENTRENCEKAIQMFLGGSDTLTDAAFAFADKGERAYMDAYWMEADITRSREHAVDTLRAYKLSEIEEAALAQVSFLSNDLMDLETHSQRLISEAVGIDEADMPKIVALYALTAAERAMKPEQKREKANELLFGRQYTAQKDEIIRTVQNFSYHLNDRFGTAAVANMHMAWLFIAVGFSVFIIVSFFIIKNAQIADAERHIALQKEFEDARFQDEYLRIAISQMRKHLIKYDIAGGTFTLESSKNVKAAGELETLLEEFGGLADNSRQRIREMCAEIKKGKLVQNADVAMIDPARGERWLRFDSTTLFGDDSKPRFAVITFFDCTEQLEHELAYTRVQQTYSTLPMESLVLIECNLTQDIYERRSGGLMSEITFSAGSLFDTQSRIYAQKYVIPEDRTQALLFLNRERLIGAFQDGKYADSLECRIEQDEKISWMRFSVQMVPYPDTGDIKLYLTLMDIDEEKRSNLELIHTAECDALTGVYNRKTFEKMVGRRLEANGSRNHMLIMIDIDDFKSINDTYGHDQADVFLQNFTKGICSELRGDDIVGRIGGDEFMVLMVDVATPQVMQKRAQSFISKIPLRMGTNRVATTVSMGVSVFPKDGDSFGELYKKADIALYKIKKNGKNSFCFYIDGMGTGSNGLTEFDSAQ